LQKFPPATMLKPLLLALWAAPAAANDWAPRLAPKVSESDPDSYYPSVNAWASGLPSSVFAELPIATPYSGDKKILVLCTTKHFLEVSNGLFFNTGHQTTEMLLPMYHLDKAGFSFDIATPDGAPAAYEEWTFGLATGYEDKLRGVVEKYSAALSSPKVMSSIPLDLNDYAAVFMPGGHGPLIEQHTIPALGAILRSAHEQSLTTITLCHGPNALRSAAIGGEFPYHGYKLVMFPDAMDRQSPNWGYLPGQLKESDFLQSNLEQMGMLVQNTQMDDSTFVDRELITGSSQMASQALSDLAVRTLADKYGFVVGPQPALLVV